MIRLIFIFAQGAPRFIRATIADVRRLREFGTYLFFKIRTVFAALLTEAALSITVEAGFTKIRLRAVPAI
jgi:hypothetical protein